MEMDVEHSFSLALGPQTSTPRPVPEIFIEPRTFSTKKDRRFTKKIPPPPPVKSCPARSRFLRRVDADCAEAISFREEDNNSFLTNSRLYDHTRSGSFFEQCFEIVELLGTGSFGKVFRVRNKEDQKEYAVKVFRERFKGEGDRKRKLEEVRRHQELPVHANCVEFCNAWQEQGQLFIQMELCKMSLTDFADRNPNLPETLVWFYLVDLIQAVKHLHDHDLIHLDLKPENIFVTAQGLCKLGDFGLVFDIAKDKESDATEGDPKYMAPELMNGVFSKAADIFSLGMTILELASDVDLPKGGDLWHLLRMGHVPKDFAQSMSADLCHVIESMIDPNPVTRISCETLLQLPAIQKMWNWRTWGMCFQSLMNCVVGVVIRVLLVLILALQTMLLPAVRSIEAVCRHKGGLPDSPPHTPVNSNLSFISATQDVSWNHSYSDDDPVEAYARSFLRNSLDSSTESLSDISFEEHKKRMVNSTPAQVRDRRSPLFVSPRKLNFDIADEDDDDPIVSGRSLLSMFDDVADEKDSD